MYTEDTQEEMAHTDDIVHAVGLLVIEDEGEAKARSIEQTLHIGTIEGDGAAWMTDVLTNRSPIRYKLDTGAQANILPYAVYRQMTSRLKLLKATTRLFAYEAVSPISVAGQCVCEVSVQGGISRKLRFYVLAADVKAVPLLGLTACVRLDFIRRGGAGMADVGSVSTFSDDPVVGQYLDLFEGAGKLLGAQYSIKLRENALPVALAAARRVAYPQYRKVEEELKQMQRLGVIEEVSEPSEWCSPMVVVHKRDATVRICVDYGKLNEFVQREHYHLPTAEEIFAKMKGAKYFSTLDAAAGFWQIPLDPTSSALTAFITPFGRFRFKRLLFGLSSGPEVFHRTMRHIFSGLEGVDCFIDDVIIWGSTREEHDQWVRRVLERLRDKGVKLQAAKCKFRLKEVTYYGHILSMEGIKVSPQKVQAITQMQCPENKDDLRRFLGLVAYVAKFLKNKAHLSPVT